jgi:putative IMPACT (imprinted ancient) family translation regulator
VKGEASPGDGAYARPATVAEAELREKGSLFLARVEPVTDAAAAAAAIAAVAAAHADASHVCWAWRLAARPGQPPWAGALGPEPGGAEVGVLERSHDAGEPGGTAGAPILQALRGAELVDALATVVRWFGGTKLGKGGLVRAYGGVARAACAEVGRAWVVPRCRLAVTLAYPRLGAVQRLVRPPAVELVAVRYGEQVEVELAVWASRRGELLAALADLGLAARPLS